MKIKEVRELAEQDLVQKEKTLKKELFELNYKKKFGQVEKPGRFRLIHREIARIKTILKERQTDGRKSK